MKDLGHEDPPIEGGYRGIPENTTRTIQGAELREIRAVLAKQGMHIVESKKCEECGLLDLQEPSVGVRFPSGRVHCSDCARKAAGLLSTKEMTEIGRQVHEDFATVVKEVEEISKQLDSESEKRAQEKVHRALYRL